MTCLPRVHIFSTAETADAIWGGPENGVNWGSAVGSRIQTGCFEGHSSISAFCLHGVLCSHGQDVLLCLKYQVMEHEDRRLRDFKV